MKAETTREGSFLPVPGEELGFDAVGSWESLWPLEPVNHLMKAVVGSCEPAQWLKC